MIFSILNYFLHLFVGWTPEKQKILIVGYNDRVRKLLNRGDSEAKIYLWTDKFLSEEEKKSLFLKNIMVETEKYQISNNSKDEKETIEKYNKFLKDNDITDVLLLDESDFHNMTASSYYLVARMLLHLIPPFVIKRLPIPPPHLINYGHCPVGIPRPARSTLVLKNTPSVAGPVRSSSAIVS